MPVTLAQYAVWLDERELLWPVAPAAIVARANPFVEPLPGIRAVTWNIYGTLLTISDGQLLLLHPQELRMQIALEKTIHEFNMWYSMTRKPGAPWEYLLPKYRKFVEEQFMASSGRKGDLTEANSTDVWRRILGLLEQKEYHYDVSFYGDLDELAEKVAYFFHRCLQGVAAAGNALNALRAVGERGIRQGLLADAQPFTPIQMLRALEAQGKLPAVPELFSPGCCILSFQVGVRKPSLSLYQRFLQQVQRLGLEAGQVLHVGSRLVDDLSIAKKLGFRTALYAGDKSSLQATAADLRDPNLKPDRLLTDLGQIRQILAID